MTLAQCVLGAALCVALAGCGETPQTSGTRKADVAAYDGVPGAAFSAPGWKAGDEASWEAQMKTRSQGQNEYSRATAP